MSIDIRFRRALLASLVIAAAACGGDSSGPSAPPPPVPAATVNATPAEKFTPGNVAVLQGGTVTFAFGSLAHNVFFDGAPAGAPANITAATSNGSVTLTFNTKGTFNYNCHIHPSMHGTVVVE